MNNAYVEFDNGKKISPKDIANLIARLRKTGSEKEMAHVLKIEYKFTNDDVIRFRIILESLKKNWDMFGGGEKK